MKEKSNSKIYTSYKYWEKYNKLYDQAIKSRGTFLDIAYNIENCLSDILSLHYFISSKKFKECKLLIHRYISFSSKIDILNTLLKSSYPDILKEYNKLTNKLQNMRSFRNKIVHAKLDIPINPFVEDSINDINKDNIHLKYYDKGRIHSLNFTNTEIKNKMSESLEIQQSLINIWGKIYDKIIKERILEATTK